MSDFDDDFFNVARDDIDNIDNSSTVLIQSKKQLGNTTSKRSNLLSSVDNLPTFNNTNTQIIDSDENTDDDTDINKTEVRGRSKTRNSYISVSSGSSRESSLSSISRDTSSKRVRSRSSSFEIESQFEYEMKRRKKIMNQAHSSDLIEHDENDDFFKELELMSSSSINSKSLDINKAKDHINDDDNRSNTIDLDLQSTSNDNNNNNNCNIVSSTSSSNPKRIYKIRFLSKLEGTINKSVHVKVLGKYIFENILPPALMGLVKAYKVPKSLQRFYEPDNVVLYRNESMKLFRFMNCNSLNIPQSFENEISDVEIVLVSKDKETEYERMVNEKIFDDESILDDIHLDLDQNDMHSQSEQELEREEQERKEKNEQLLKIALRGEDNKKVYVNVRNSTSFQKLVDYYRIQKQIPKNKKIILSFENDQLDLGKCIQDHEIEDEDVIDVIIK